MVSMRAPSMPITRPTIYMGMGNFISRTAETIETRMACVPSKAEEGPIGAPV